MSKKKIDLDQAILEKQAEMNKLIEDIKGIDKTLGELEEQYSMAKEALKERYEDKKCLWENKRQAKQNELRALFEQVPQRETKTQKKVVLLNGDVIVKKPKQTYKKDTEKLLEWAQQNDKDELITRKETLSFKWADFKKRLVPLEDGIVDGETGEFLHIEGLEPMMTKEEIDIHY